MDKKRYNWKLTAWLSFIYRKKFKLKVRNFCEWTLMQKYQHEDMITSQLDNLRKDVLWHRNTSMSLFTVVSNLKSEVLDLRKSFQDESAKQEESRKSLFAYLERIENKLAPGSNIYSSSQILYWDQTLRIPHILTLTRILMPFRLMDWDRQQI